MHMHTCMYVFTYQCSECDSECSQVRRRLLRSPRLLAALLDAMVDTGAVPAACGADPAIRADGAPRT